MVADGFRNAYGFDFNPDGEPFTYDSDNERCVGLPWYEPCRFYHVVPGGNYGWRSPQLSQTWRKPPYFADVVPPICTTGRGSPTGVACYRHTHFPEHYRGGFFLADWTFGKIQFVPLERSTAHTPASRRCSWKRWARAASPRPRCGPSEDGRPVREHRRPRHARSTASPTIAAAGEELPIAKRSLEWNADEAKQWVKDATGPDAMTHATRWK